MAIDNPFDAIEKAYPENQPYLPGDLAAFAAKCLLPPFVTDALGTVYKRLDQSVRLERAQAITKLFITELKDLQEKK